MGLDEKPEAWVNEPGRIFVARELSVEELNVMAAELMAAGEEVDRAKAKHEKARSNWRMMMEVPENHEKYYKQYKSITVTRRNQRWQR